MPASTEVTDDQIRALREEAIEAGASSVFCVSRQFLFAIGMDDRTVDRLTNHPPGGGLVISPHSSFGGRDGRRCVAAVEAEPAPRRITLVGVADWDGAGSALGETREILLSDDRRWHRLPNVTEARDLAADMSGRLFTISGDIRDAHPGIPSIIAALGWYAALRV